MKALVLLMFIFLIPFSLAATISGDVYDFTLEPDEALVEINTTPIQKRVATPHYEFDVGEGTYLIKASKLDGEYLEAYVEEEITVEGRGFFYLDLILFPEVNPVDLEDPELDDFEEENGSSTSLPWTLTPIFIALIVIFVLYRKPKNKHQMEPDAKAVLDFITKKKRTTQKEIRQEFPHSEAKISLIITELESKGLIRKIKKGRGNIILRN